MFKLSRAMQAIDQALGTQVAPGASCAIGVQLSPQQSGPLSTT